MGNPVGKVLGKLAKWLVKKGKEELENEVSERLAGKEMPRDLREPPRGIQGR